MRGGQLFFGKIWWGSTNFLGKTVGVNYFSGKICWGQLFFRKFLRHFFFLFFCNFCTSRFDFCCTPDSCLVFRSRLRSYFSCINIFPILDRFPRSHRAHVSCHIGAKALSKRGIQGDNMYISRGKKHFI